MISDPKAKEISSMMDGYQKSFILAAAVRLNLFQKLAYFPYQVPELASNCGIKTNYMYRVLSALQCMGLVNVCKDAVELTDKGYLIVTNAELRDYLLISSVEWIKSWSFLFETLCNQKVALVYFDVGDSRLEFLNKGN